MFSQKDEEKYILEYWGDRIGKFLDIGAYDGKTFSNTHALALKGWGGVCIEPNDKHCEAIRNLYKERIYGHGMEEYWDYVAVVCAAVGLTTEKVPFYKSPDAVSTTLKSHMEKWKATGQYTETEIDQLSIYDVVRRYGDEFDFVNIDTEGTSMDILNAMPMYPEMICVEHDGMSLVSYCEKNGYKVIHITPENTILVKI